MPLTVKTPPLSVIVADVAAVPSPQLIVVPAVKSPTVPSGLVSVKVATAAVSGAPSVPLIATAVALLSGASAIVALSDDVAVAVLPPSSTIVTIGV